MLKVFKKEYKPYQFCYGELDRQYLIPLDLVSEFNNLHKQIIELDARDEDNGNETNDLELQILNLFDKYRINNDLQGRIFYIKEIN